MIPTEYRNQIVTGDALAELRKMPDGFVQCCVTSPPYYSQRSYLPDDHPNKSQEIGLEITPNLYVTHLVEVFREVRRILTPDGTLWLNLGDGYAGSWGNYAPNGIKGTQRPRTEKGKRRNRKGYPNTTWLPPAAKSKQIGLKDKDLIGAPWRVAFALQTDGWWLRSAITWCKSPANTESIKDRPSKATEMVFLLSKSDRYYYSYQAATQFTNGLLDWWVIAPASDEDHTAPMPSALAERCIVIGSREGDLVLDPFLGNGTTAEAAYQCHRHYIGIELNPTSVESTHRRIATIQQNLWTGEGVA